jgi:sodium-dependent dicarboxylate transporter 2/3/5
VVVTFLTEATSNTATTALLMPVLAAVALAVEIDPLWLMVPAAMSASCAFMLPVATAPNAVVFGTGELPIQRMVREGLFLNFIGALIIATVLWLRLS